VYIVQECGSFRIFLAQIAKNDLIEMNSVITRNQIIRILKAEKSFLNKEFGVTRIGIFGSFAKGKESDESDIDFIVEMKQARFDHLAGLQIYLEKKFSRKIEIVRKGKNVSGRFAIRLENEAIYA